MSVQGREKRPSKDREKSEERSQGPSGDGQLRPDQPATVTAGTWMAAKGLRSSAGDHGR